MLAFSPTVAICYRETIKNFRFQIFIILLLVGSAITYLPIPPGMQKLWTLRVHLTVAIENNKEFSAFAIKYMLSL